MRKEVYLPPSRTAHDRILFADPGPSRVVRSQALAEIVSGVCIAALFLVAIWLMVTP